MTLEELQSLHNKIDNQSKDITAIKTALSGYNGQDGLCKQVEKNSKQINYIWIILALIVASTGGGAYALAHALISKGL